MNWAPVILRVVFIAADWKNIAGNHMQSRSRIGNGTIELNGVFWKRVTSECLLPSLSLSLSLCLSLSLSCAAWWPCRATSGRAWRRACLCWRRTRWWRSTAPPSTKERRTRRQRRGATWRMRVSGVVLVPLWWTSETFSRVSADFF